MESDTIIMKEKLNKECLLNDMILNYMGVVGSRMSDKLYIVTDNVGHL